MKRFVLFILMITLVAPVQWATAETPQRGGRLVVCQPAEPPSGLDPTAGTSAAIDRIVYANIYEGLVKTNRNGKYLINTDNYLKAVTSSKIGLEFKVYYIIIKSGSCVTFPWPTISIFDRHPSQMG